MHDFWDTGGADFVIEVGIILVIIIVGAITVLRIRRGNIRVVSDAGPLPPSQEQLAQNLFIRATRDANVPLATWLRWFGSDIRFRILAGNGGYVVERTEQDIWPPIPCQPVRIISMVIRPDQRYVPKFTVDVEVSEDRKIPVSVSMVADQELPAINGTLYAQTGADATEITNWLQLVTEARQE